MATCGTTNLPSNAPVFISEEIRNDLGFGEADQFVVIGQSDTMIRKVITPPKLEAFEKRSSQARAACKALAQGTRFCLIGRPSINDKGARGLPKSNRIILLYGRIYTP